LFILSIVYLDYSLFAAAFYSVWSFGGLCASLQG
jgi:hypothetical protein